MQEMSDREKQNKSEKCIREKQEEWFLLLPYEA